LPTNIVSFPQLLVYVFRQPGKEAHRLASKQLNAIAGGYELCREKENAEICLQTGAISELLRALVSEDPETRDNCMAALGHLSNFRACRDNICFLNGIAIILQATARGLSCGAKADARGVLNQLAGDNIPTQLLIRIDANLRLLASGDCGCEFCAYEAISETDYEEIKKHT
jgi:hypothetical protein